MRKYIDAKGQKLTRYYEDIIDLEVILDIEKQQFITELKINASGTILVLKETAEELRKSFDLAVDRAETRLKRHKGKKNPTDKDIIKSA